MIKNHYLYPFILAAIAITVSFAGLNPEQVASVTVFSSLIVGTLEIAQAIRRRRAQDYSYDARILHQNWADGVTKG